MASPAKEDESLRATGRVLARVWPEHLPDRLTYVPDTFLNDIPTLVEPCCLITLRPLLMRQTDLVAGWMASGLYLSRHSDQFSGPLELLEAAAELCAHIDGKRSVDQLASVQGCPDLGRVCTLISALSMLGIVRGGAGPERRETAEDRSSVANPSGHLIPVAPRGTPFFCSRPWTGFEVGEEDGVVRMCCWAKDGYGNVNKDSIATIWNQAPIRRMRQLMAEGAWEQIAAQSARTSPVGCETKTLQRPLGRLFKRTLSLVVFRLRNGDWFCSHGRAIGR